MKLVSDPYLRRARLEPALLVALPLTLAMFAWWPAAVKQWGLLWSFVVWSGGSTLLANVARDSGKRKEASLFVSWGGKPTTRLLRFRGSANVALVARRHQQLQLLMPSLQLPTETSEIQDTNAADALYESSIAFLIEKTRDRKKFELLFDENCNYGFRRNLWGMRPLGLALASIGLVALAVLFGWQVRANVVNPTTIACLAMTVLLLLGWIFWFTPGWVRIPAEAYAERLLASCDVLEPAKPKATRARKT